MISHCTCYCWKGPGHLRDGAGVSAILFVCSFADPTLFPPFLQVLSLQFLSYVLHAFKQTCWCTIRYLCLIFTWLVYFRSFIFSFVGSDPDPSLFWCNNETAVSGESLESCKNNYNCIITITTITLILKMTTMMTTAITGKKQEYGKNKKYHYNYEYRA